LLVPGLGKSNLLEALGSVGAVMGILIGFTLSRLASTDREQTNKYLELFRLSRILVGKISDSRERRFAETRVVQLLHQCTEYFFAGARSDRMRLSTSVREELYAFSRNVSSNCKTELTSSLQEIEAKLNEWLVLKTERMPTVEWMALSGLSVFFAIIFAVFRENNLGGDLAAILLSAGTGFLIATLRDLDVDRPAIGEERLLLVLEAYRLIDARPYIPAHLASNEDFALWSLHSILDVETRDDLGNLVEKRIHPPTKVERFSFLTSLASVFIIGLAIVAYKHITKLGP
jgi:hypothetical protein